MAPPRRALALRARPRRGSVERPINARMVRGTWLLVALPLLLAAFTVGRPQPLPPPALPPAFDPVTAEQLARELARDYPDRSPGSAGAIGAASWLHDEFALYGPDPQEERFTASIPGLGRVRADESRRGRARSVPPQDRDHGPPGQQRRGAGRERQRLRHRGARRALPGVRPGNRDDVRADAALAHARLRLHRRRRLRRARSRTLRRELPVPRGHGGRDQPRRDRRLRSASPPDRRRHGALTGRLAGTHRGGPRPRAVRRRAAASLRAAAAARPRLPVHVRRAGALRRPRHSGSGAHDRSARARLRASPTAGSAARGWASSGVRLRTSSARSTQGSS